jgi:predicted amidohydrolase YtcJ
VQKASSEKMSVEDALVSYTQEKGASAAVHVRCQSARLRRDIMLTLPYWIRYPLFCDPRELDQIKVMMTVMNGETVFEK